MAQSVTLPSAGQRSLCGDQRGRLGAWSLDKLPSGSWDSVADVPSPKPVTDALETAQPVGLAYAFVSSEKLTVQVWQVQVWLQGYRGDRWVPRAGVSLSLPCGCWEWPAPLGGKNGCFSLGTSDQMLPASAFTSLPTVLPAPAPL